MNISDPAVYEIWHNRSQEYADNSTCTLKPDPDPRVREGLPADVLDSDAPVYVYVAQFDTFVEIRYVYFYPYNGAYNLLHLFNYLDVRYGEHYQDFEHITLRFARRTGGSVSLVGIYFAAHTSHEGVWRAPGEVSWLGGHPVAYVAYGSHGSYPKPGTYLRIFGLASDFCRAGRLWRPRVVLLNGARREWERGAAHGLFLAGDPLRRLYDKTLGDPGPETNESTSFVRRLMYLYPDNLYG